MRLADQIVLITGAAGQLGRTMAQAFAREGAILWLADTSEESLNRTVSTLPAHQVAGTLIFDITKPDAVETAFQSVETRSGCLDVLVNNAGIGVFTPFWDRSFDDFMSVLAVNVGGTFLCTRAALRIMKNRGEGSIVNIGSVYGLVSSDPRIYTDCSRINSEVYSASKAGVIQMTKYFAAHAANDGIRVNCVSPGGIFNNQGADFVANYSTRTPAGRMGNETEICGAVLFLASKESSYVSGQNIVVDGGFTAW